MAEEVNIWERIGKGLRYYKECTNEEHGEILYKLRARGYNLRDVSYVWDKTVSENRGGHYIRHYIGSKAPEECFYTKKVRGKNVKYIKDSILLEDHYLKMMCAWPVNLIEKIDCDLFYECLYNAMKDLYDNLEVNNG